MNFYRTLGKKLARDPSAGVERDLQRRLDEAFGTRGGWSFRFEIFRFAPIAMAAGLLIVLGNQIERTTPKTDPAVAFNFSADEVESSLMQGDRYEFYDEMEDWMLTASDEDWDAILEKNG